MRINVIQEATYPRINRYLICWDFHIVKPFFIKDLGLNKGQALLITSSITKKTKKALKLPSHVTVLYLKCLLRYNFHQHTLTN